MAYDPVYQRKLEEIRKAGAVGDIGLYQRSIKDWCKDVYAWAVRLGWHEQERSPGDYIALMHTELSEAFEEHRAGHAVDEVYYQEGREGNPIDDKPEGFPVELADVVIRIFDFCGRYNIPLEDIIARKMTYNETRPYRHGGKVV